MSRSYDQVMDVRQRQLAFEVVLERYWEKLSRPHHLSELVHRKLAWEALLIAARAYDKGRTARTPVEELVAFALDCYPDARRLPIYHTLQVRQRIGARHMRYLQPFVLSSVARKAKWWWWNQPWQFGSRPSAPSSV
jgi:hypothetical protein